MPDENIEQLQEATYLKAIENSVGSKIFNSLFVRFKDSGKTADVMNDGMYSCALFVSSVLYLFGAVDKPYATVKNIRDSLMKNPKWKEVGVDDLRAGDVIFWEKIRFDDGSENAHVGFALNEHEAVSTDYKQKVIARHPIIREDAPRNVETVYRYAWPQ